MLKSVTLQKIFQTYPCTLASNELVIFCLHTGPAANIKVFGLKVRVIQLFWCLGTKGKTGTREGQMKRMRIKDKSPVSGKMCVGVCVHVICHL